MLIIIVRCLVGVLFLCIVYVDLAYVHSMQFFDVNLMHVIDVYISIYLVFRPSACVLPGSWRSNSLATYTTSGSEPLQILGSKVKNKFLCVCDPHAPLTIVDESWKMIVCSKSLKQLWSCAGVISLAYK